MKLAKPFAVKKKKKEKVAGHYTEAVAKLKGLSPVRMLDLEEAGQAFKAQPAMRSYFSRIAKAEGFEYKSIPAGDGNFWIVRIEAE